jgi:hypothetical protein
VTVYPWELDPSKVEPSKANSKMVALVGVCEQVRPDTPPKIGGRLSRRREQRGFCGSPMMSD